MAPFPYPRKPALLIKVCIRVQLKVRHRGEWLTETFYGSKAFTPAADIQNIQIMSSDLELDHPLWMFATLVPVARRILQKSFLLTKRLAFRGFTRRVQEVAWSYKVIFSDQTAERMYYFHTCNKPRRALIWIIYNIWL